MKIVADGNYRTRLDAEYAMQQALKRGALMGRIYETPNGWCYTCWGNSSSQREVSPPAVAASR
jgi:hypothetical protein